MKFKMPKVDDDGNMTVVGTLSVNDYLYCIGMTNYGGMNVHGDSITNGMIASAYHTYVPENASTHVSLIANAVYLVSLMNTYGAGGVWIVSTQANGGSKTSVPAILVNSSYFTITPDNLAYGFTIKAGGANGYVTYLRLC